MTRIQLRRDTAANWTKNNPVLAAGEPAYETDTGKFKIGDGSKTYTALPYKGEGGSSGGGTEIDDTTTATDKVWSSSKTNTEVQQVAGEVVNVQADVADLDSLTSTLSTDVAGLKTTTSNLSSSVDTLNTEIATKQDKLTAGNNITIENNVISAAGGSTPDNMVTTDTAQSITGIKTFNNDIKVSQWTSSGTIRETHIDLSKGSGNNFIAADGIDKEFGLYGRSTTGIRINSSLSAGNKYGLLVQPSALTFTSNDGTVTDLLAIGGGATYTAGANITISDDNEIALSSNPNLNNATIQTLYCPTLNMGYYGGYGIAPNITYTESAGLKINGDAFTSSGKVLKPITIVGESLKFGDRTNQYDVITKSTTNNEYMAHMAMPSDKYVDLTLGASGTTYTAPADGYFHIRKVATVAGKYISAGIDGLYYLTVVSTIANETFGLLFPMSKGQILKCTYSADGDTKYFRFIYANGTAPTT